MSDLDASITIRAASPDDAEAIARVHYESWQTTYAGILPLDVIASHVGRRDAATWRNRLETPAAGSALWLAEREGEIAGFASCGDARHRLESLEAEIYALYVLQRHQRRGVGRELVRACARHFVLQGHFGFYLWVLKANRARMFYDAMGGQEIAEKRERLGLHSFVEVAYAWHDVTPLVVIG